MLSSRSLVLWPSGFLSLVLFNFEFWEERYHVNLIKDSPSLFGSSQIFMELSGKRRWVGGQWESSANLVKKRRGIVFCATSQFSAFMDLWHVLYHWGFQFKCECWYCQISAFCGSFQSSAFLWKIFILSIAEEVETWFISATLRDDHGYVNVYVYM